MLPVSVVRISSAGEPADPADCRPVESQDPREAVDHLFTALDPLAHPARMRALATWVQGLARNDGDMGRLRPLLGELETRGLYGRRLAAFAAAIGGNVPFLEARLADPDGAVRGHALKSSLRLPEWRTLLRVLRRHPHPEVREAALALTTAAE
ncbi:hypothetical protein [Kitasatospora sp. NPDC087315]|uniref:hypothetical protein n=1 Tax=Kitasatospora sp. NPDC087315 TaxID=3364069 RepID=UPI003804CF4D